MEIFSEASKSTPPPVSKAKPEEDSLTPWAVSFSHATPAIILKEADADLEDEDLLNMVNTGVVGITVTDDLTAALWSKVYEQLNVHTF